MTIEKLIKQLQEPTKSEARLKEVTKIEQLVRHFKVSPGESPTKNATRKYLSVRKHTHRKAMDAHTQALAGGARDGGGEKD